MSIRWKENFIYFIRKLLNDDAYSGNDNDYFEINDVNFGNDDDAGKERCDARHWELVAECGIPSVGIPF